MTVRKGLGLQLVALASLLFLLISVSAGEEVDHDERLPLLPMDIADLELRSNSVVDINDDAKPENEWPFMQNRRVRRGFKFPKVGPRLPAVRMPPPRVTPFRLNTAAIARSYHTPPKVLAGFPNLVRVKPKSSVRGGGGLRKRWEDKNTKKIYEWDSQHGELEAYSKNKVHLGSYNPQTGEKIKDAVPGRRLKD